MDSVWPHPETPSLGDFHVGSGLESGGEGRGSFRPWSTPSPGLVPLSHECSDLLILQFHQVLQPGHLHLQNLQEHTPEGRLSTLLWRAASAPGCVQPAPLQGPHHQRSDQRSSNRPLWVETTWVPEISLRPQVIEGRPGEGGAALDPRSLLAGSLCSPAQQLSRAGQVLGANLPRGQPHVQGSLLKGNSREHVPVQTDGQDHPPGAPAQLSSSIAAAPQPSPSKAKVPQANSLPGRRAPTTPQQ